MIEYFLATAPSMTDLFGVVTPPPGSEAFVNPFYGLGRLLITGIRISIIVTGLAALIYLLWGAFNWTTSQGEEEKLEQARLQMTNAVIGFVLVIAALAIFSLVSGDILGVIIRDKEGNWVFKLPSINQCITKGQSCNLSGSYCCPGSSCSQTPGAPTGVATCQ